MSSCVKEDQFTGGADGNGLISFELNLVDGAQTRAISDGAKVDKLVYAVYDENGILLNAADDLTTPEVESQVVKVYANGLLGRNEKVNCKLVKGHTYQILFWAQDNDCTAYNTDNLTNVVVDYNDVNNSDLRDAFAGYVNLTVEGDQTVQVTMTRPFAQVNVGTTVADWEAAVKAGVTIATSKVEMTGVANTINLLTGQVGTAEDEIVNVTLAAAAIPAAAETGEEVLTVKKADGTTAAYKYLSMSYVLAGNIAPADVTSAVIPSVKYYFYEETEVGEGTQPAFAIESGLSNVPVKANWRTNIIGELFTNSVAFEIIVDPVYGTPDNVVEYPFFLKEGDLTTGEGGEISDEMKDKLMSLVDNGALALEGKGSDEDVKALGTWLKSVDGSVIQTLDLTKYDIDEIPAAAFGAAGGNGETAEFAEIKLPVTVKTIGADAFRSTDVEVVEMPGVTEIGANAYASSPLKTVVLSETDMVTIGDRAFDGCRELTTIINSENIESIGLRAFQKNTSLESLNLENCKSIADYAFSSCSNLQSVNLSSIQTIGSNAFARLTKLTTVNLPVDSDVTMAGNAFNGCSELTTINLGKLSVISSYAFTDCKKLNNVDLSNVVTVKSSAFSGCVALTNVSLPKVTSIDFYAFQNCTSLAEVRVESKSDITLGSSNMYPFSKLPSDAVLYLHNDGLTKNTVSGTKWANYTWSAIKYVDDSGNVIE